MPLIGQLSQTVQTEYGLAYALTIGLVVLGLLVVCIPRPRKNAIPDEADNTGEKNARKRSSRKRK